MLAVFELTPTTLLDENHPSRPRDETAASGWGFENPSHGTTQGEWVRPVATAIARQRPDANARLTSRCRQLDDAVRVFSGGLAFLPLSGAVVIAAAIANALIVPRTGPRPVVASGMALTAIAMVVIPEHAHFDDARRAWNLAIEQRPTTVVYPESPRDVAAAVLFAREFGQQIAAEGTEHNAGPLGSLENTILLKTERMRGAIDPARRAARVEAGVVCLARGRRGSSTRATTTRPTHGAPQRQSVVPVAQLARARHVAPRFLVGYLPFAYGRASASSVPAVAASASPVEARPCGPSLRGRTRSARQDPAKPGTADNPPA